MTPEWLISSGRTRERCDSRNILPHWEFTRRGLFWFTAAQHGQCMWACTGTKLSWIKPNTSSQQVCFYLWEKSYFVFGFGFFFPSFFFLFFISLLYLWEKGFSDRKLRATHKPSPNLQNSVTKQKERLEPLGGSSGVHRDNPNALGV